MGPLLRGREVAVTRSPRFAISLAQWSLHRAILSGELSGLDLPRIARRRFGIEGVELVSTLLGPPRAGALRALRRQARDEGVAIVLLMVDGAGDLAAPSRRERQKATSRHRRWLEGAAALGCSAVRVNTGGIEPWSPALPFAPIEAPALRARIERCAESLAALADWGAAAGLSILLENHGGISSNPRALLATLDASGRPNVGTLPDFGNLPPGADRYEVVRLLLPRARGVSAKAHDFAPDGAETTMDYPRLLELVTSSGYEGWIGIEYEGERLPEEEGVRKTKALLERCLDGFIAHCGVPADGARPLRSIPSAPAHGPPAPA